MIFFRSLCVLTFFISVSCSKNQSTKDVQKENTYLERTVAVDSLLLKKADSLMASGRAAYSKRDFAQSVKNLFQADSILQSQEQWSLVVRNLVNTISLAQGTKQSQDSIEALIKHTQGIVDRIPEDDWDRGNFFQKKSYIASANYQETNGKFYALKALDVFLANPQNPRYYQRTSMSYRTLGSAEEGMSNFEKAIGFYEKAIRIEEQANIVDGHSHAQLFYLHVKLGNNEKALQLIDLIESKNLLEKSNLFTAFDYYRDRAYFYVKLKQYDKALKMLDKQDELIDGTPYRVHFAAWYQNQLKSEIYTGMGNYSKAIAILNAIHIEDGVSKNIRDQRSANALMLADNYLLKGDEENYEYHIQEAINFLQNKKQRDFFDTSSYENVISKERILSVLQSKSTYCLEKYTKTKEVHYKTLALHCFEQQHALINQIGAISDEDRFIGGFNYKKMYDDYLSLLHEVWLENPTQGHFYKVLTIVDQSKNNVVLGEIKKMQKERLFKNIPQDLLEQEHNLKYTLDTISIMARGEEYLEKIDSITRKLETVKQILKTEYPKYYQLSYGNTVSIESQLKEYFSEDNVISFLVGEQHTYVLNKNGDKQLFDKIEFNNAQLHVVEDYLKFIRTPSEQGYAELETSLYTMLFEKYSQADGSTVLSLDDILYLLPVEGIISNHTTANNQSFVRVNSLLTHQKYESDTKSDPLIFAPFAISERKERALPGTLKEVTNVKDAIGGSIKLNADATKKVFLDQAKTSGVIHIATHANVNVKAPLKSTIFFSETLDQEPSETQLQLKELYGLRLDNELVTLSACETGLGKEIKGKGLQSISNAFAYAGVGSTVMSLWQVPDAQTEQIMTTFYTNLSEGQQKDVALQNSKEAYLQSVDDDALKHPYYWAGFVISGDVSALKRDSPMLLYFILGGVLILIIFWVYWYTWRKKVTSSHSS